jgi:prolyl-tRNA editing enzyme YbaK/EbsC (Cys-tRNA(Pro) deacylase)
METSAEIWSPHDLQAYLIKHDILAEIMILEAETPTVPAAAEALNVDVEQIGKTVIFFIDGVPYAIIGNGIRRVDQKKLAARFGVNRKKIKLADGNAVIRLTGYAPGTVPPVGHRETLPILMDPAVCQNEIIFAGGGGINAMLRIKSSDLLRITNAEVLDVLE